MEDFTKEERIADVHWHIDNGYINHKKCFSIFGSNFLKLYTKHKRPNEEYPNNVYNDDLLVRLALLFCQANKLPTLSEVLQNPKTGSLFCSIETFEGNEDVYEKRRIKNRIITPFEFDKKVEVEFSTKFITCDTGSAEQSDQNRIAIIGQVYKIINNIIIIHPLIMGGATFDNAFQKSSVPIEKLLFEGSDWFEIKPEEIDNFSKISEVQSSSEEWQSFMIDKTEDFIKKMFCEILGDISKKDWGGELNDHFSSSVTISGKRFTAAFLLKGPAGGRKFKEMTPLFLGKNGDQICRLIKTSADIVILQHCHDIGEAVRETLQAFAVAPHIQKRYCIIDGKDTYRILKAYGKI